MYWVLKRNYIEDEFSHWSIVNKQDQFMLPRGIDGVCVSGDDIERDIASVEIIDDEIKIVEDSAKKELKLKKKDVESSVKDELQLVFGNKTDEELNYDFLSAVTKIVAASKYSTLGLKAEMDTDTFLTGDLLDTATKIKNYYIEILSGIDKKRDLKIKEYKDLKKK